ncbi:alpha-amylase family protein [Paenibacillus cymbidii]|uniref:hypothetical protein n=1 Tax=Paenibacillus cymbidii TaxID=1639034 RepID=UPI0010811751|nr:hypothetical protein [Paenibacillus cymbidii]
MANEWLISAHNADAWTLEWELRSDRAIVKGSRTSAVIWQGGLLPSFELHTEGGNEYVQGTVEEAVQTADNTYTLRLAFGRFGSGHMRVATEAWGLRIADLETEWSLACGIVALYFGARVMDDVERSRAPRTDRPFWPAWRSELLCVPCAGAGVTRSVMRVWELGNATLPLGSFGSATGSLYAAAFPRPVYAAALGGKAGWLAVGPGAIQGAALSLQVQGSTTCLTYAYREDLWQPADRHRRRWDEPLRLAWGASAYDAYDRLYATFPASEPKDAGHQRSFLCTWGDFRIGRFDLREYADRVAASLPAQLVVIDDPWESSMGSGRPNLERFPGFDESLAYLKGKGYGLALWQSIGWIDKPEEAGLGDDDLICGADGKPRQYSWNGDPLAGGGYHYCLDPSSERTRRYLTERTERIVRTYDPVALKLDFGYGLPGPDAGAPRDPSLRGERLCAELLRIVGDAARAAKPGITLIYYGVHPLLHGLYDMINIDDLGDAGDDADNERIGHNQRCMWASLAARRGMALNTSTGYYTDAVDSIWLDTAVVGACGLTLGAYDSDGIALSPVQLGRWQALERWFRRTTGWRPLWLDADPGVTSREPVARSWGRIERLAGGDAVTALTLRGVQEPRAYSAAPGVSFSGEWALIAQDGRGCADSRELACVPFAAGVLELAAAGGSGAAIEVYRLAKDGRMRHAETIAAPPGEPIVLHVTADDMAGGLVGFVVRREAK